MTSLSDATKARERMHRVAEGVQFYQDTYGVPALIELAHFAGTLNMGDVQCCALGMINGDYTAEVVKLRLDEERLIALGFETTYGETYAELTQEWCDQLEEWGEPE